MLKLIIITVGAIVLAYGSTLCAISNLNLGVVLVVLLGAAILLCGIFFKALEKLTRHGIFKAIKIAVLVLLVAEMGLVGFLAVYGASDNVTYSEDAVIVLGAAVRGDRITLPLKYRLDKAVEYAEKNPEALIVVSGGQGMQESVTEASAMEKYLVENGVDAHRIIKEEKATSTNENMRFSKALLDERLSEGYSVAVITNGFHVYRGTEIARAEGFADVTHMGADLQWYNLLPCYLRESLAVLKLWVFG